MGVGELSRCNNILFVGAYKNSGDHNLLPVGDGEQNEVVTSIPGEHSSSPYQILKMQVEVCTNRLIYVQVGSWRF